MTRTSCFIATLAAAGILLGGASELAAKPLITSSEETHARICIAADDTPERLVAACDIALGAPDLTPRQRTELLAARGDAYLWQGENDAALASFRAALEIEGDYLSALNGIGWALRGLGDDAAAFAAFETAVATGASDEGLAGLAATGRDSGALDGARAREFLEAALAIDPDYVWAIREVGWSWFDEGNAAEARAAFERALAVDPEDENAVFGLGRAALLGNDPEAALEHFGRVLDGFPDHLPSRILRIDALRALDRNAQALRDADRLIADRPDVDSGYIARGRALMALQRRTEAFATYELAEERLGPDNTVLYWHADALATDGQLDAAMATIERGLTLEGADHHDHALKSWIALELEDFPLALSAAQAALELAETDPWSHYYAAIATVRMGDVTTGLGHFDTAMTAGLPAREVGLFARQLIEAGKYVEAAQVRLKY